MQGFQHKHPKYTSGRDEETYEIAQTDAVDGLLAIPHIAGVNPSMSDDPCN
jgi:hypothetical protein